jgi:hypothetical protein
LSSYTSLGSAISKAAIVDDSGPPETPTENIKSVRELLRVITTAIITARGKLTLPYHRQDIEDNRSCTPCDRARRLAADSSGAVHCFLALCIPFMRHGVKAYQPDVCDVMSDHEFFNKMNKMYVSIRGTQRWSFLRKVRNIEFVKVSKQSII